MRATGARIVIPVHWDDFFEPLAPPLPAAPYLMDRVDVSLRLIADYAQRDGVVFARMDAFETVDLSAAARLPAAAGANPVDCPATGR